MLDPSTLYPAKRLPPHLQGVLSVIRAALPIPRTLPWLRLELLSSLPGAQPFPGWCLLLLTPQVQLREEVPDCLIPRGSTASPAAEFLRGAHCTEIILFIVGLSLSPSRPGAP